MSVAEKPIGPEHYRAIAAFRHELRRFLSFSEASATAVGLPPQQHQALLAVAGHAGPGRPSVGSLAGHLVIAPQTAAELVSRMVEAGLLTKAASTADRRRTELALTDKAETLLGALTAAHLHELEQLEPALARAVGRPTKGPDPSEAEAGRDGGGSGIRGAPRPGRPAGRSTGSG